MTVVLLDGASGPADPTNLLRTEVGHQLQSHSKPVRRFQRVGYDIDHGMGAFDGFVKTPGRCRIHDEGQEIERAVHDAERVVLVPPMRIGGYSATLRKAVDRLLPRPSPFFRLADGLTHHALRHAHSARWAALALDDTPTAERTRLFRAFAATNALNFGSPAWGAEVVGADPTTWSAAVVGALAPPQVPGKASGTAEAARAALLRAIAPPAPAKALPPRPFVAVLQASPRPPGVSTSQAIWQYLQPSLSAGAADVQVVAATEWRAWPCLRCQQQNFAPGRRTDP